jgi:hypothetical protein
VAPTDGKPVSKFSDPDDAFLEITKTIRVAAGVVQQESPKASASSSMPQPPPDLGARSSNLRVRKAFTDRDRDQFLDETFEFMARFFENSLTELKIRNPGLETAFKRIDTTRFAATAYRNGNARARCLIQLGGQLGESRSRTTGTQTAVASTRACRLRSVIRPSRCIPSECSPTGH